jgi:hypothetical protein
METPPLLPTREQLIHALRSCGVRAQSDLVSVCESGPYAFRGDLRIDGEAFGYRATLCRCGVSKNKPFCDGSHHDVKFDASGEPHG